MYLIPSTVVVRKAFEEIGDAPFHPLRQQTGVHIDNGGNWNRDIRKDVGRHFPDAKSPQYYDEDRHHNKGVGSLEGNDDELVHGLMQSEAGWFSCHLDLMFLKDHVWNVYNYIY